MKTVLYNLHNLEIPVNGKETFHTLFENSKIRIEGIRSCEISAGQIYDQEEDEWVLLFQGSALLKINEQEHVLEAGDCLFIPSHTPHQVLSTSSDAIWVGVFSS